MFDSELYAVYLTKKVFIYKINIQQKNLKYFYVETLKYHLNLYIVKHMIKYFYFCYANWTKQNDKIIKILI